MNVLKKLAGQTAIYGISSIVGRLLNYFLVPLHTKIFFEGEFGIVTDLYAHVAFFTILYTYGMETAFFRFATKGNKQDAYNSAQTSVLISSVVFTSLIYLNASPISHYLGYPDKSHIIQWLALILFIDGIIALPFAKLRLENKALRFVLARMGGIALTVILNLVFLILFEDIHQGKYLTNLQSFVNSIYDPNLRIGYIFLANLIGNALVLLILWKEFFDFKFRIDWSYLKPMIYYGIPIFIMGIAGMVNEQIDKILFVDLLPDGFYPGKTSLDALGIYGASFKLSIFMLLGIQAFRYAAEPFFFSKSQDQDSPQLFAQVMHYFVIVCIIIFVAVSVNIDIIGKIFLTKSVFREALFIVPFLLIGKLFFGIYVNLSIWFKLTDKTIFGTYISLIGAAITLIANFILVPKLGYLGAAMAGILCYLSMAVICYAYGKKHYPIPYHLQPLAIYLIASILVVYFSFLLRFENIWSDNLLNTGLNAGFVLIPFFIEKKKFILYST